MRNTNEILLPTPIIDNPQKIDYGLPAIVFFGITYAVFNISKIFELLSEKEISLIADSNLLAFSVLAVTMTVSVLRHPALEGQQRRSWRILFAAYLTYGIGNAFWFYNSSVINEKPFPSLADAGYWGFYPLMFVALTSFSAAREDKRGFRIALDVVIVMLGGTTAVWYFLIDPIVANSSNQGILEIALNLFYTVGDLVVMMGIATLLLRGVKPENRTTIYIIIGGVICLSIADYGFAHATLKGTYYSGHWVDSFFQGSSLVFAAASYSQYKRLSNPAQLEADEAIPNSKLFSWLPYLGISVCCLILLIVTEPYWGDSVGLVVFATVAMTLLGVFRQILFVRENMQLLEEKTGRQSDVKIKTLIENSSDMISVRDMDGKIVFRSPSTKHIVGYEPEEIADVSGFEMIHPDDISDCQNHLSKLISGEIESIRTEYRVRHKNGDWLTMEGVSRRVDDAESGMHGVVTNSRDITQRKLDEERLHLFNAKLQRSNQELEDFAHVASHDLQEPLRKVRTFGDRLNKKFADQLGDEGRDYIHRMQSASSRMQTLIEGLLEYSRVSTKGSSFVETSLNQVCAEVVSDLEVRIEQTNATIEIGELPTIGGDPLQMRQLLQNLISNALKFTVPDRAPIIKISSETIGDCYKISIADNGIGFEAKYLDRIFGVFQRLHGREEYEGSGIGLSVCKKIVERHGGSITAISEPGEGATFVITLPVNDGVSGSNSDSDIPK